MSAANSPLPAPNSSTSSDPVALRICATWDARVRPNNGVNMGAVTKSPDPAMVEESVRVANFGLPAA